MTQENVETLKQTLTIWHTRKVTKYCCYLQVNHDLKLDRITVDEALTLQIWLNLLYKDE